MPERSAYDNLHDYYQNILTTKHGTRYERLAAVVFAAMERDGVVIHDLKVIGKVSGEGHQIDVHIEKKGVLKRILVECKDFDVSRGNVGLGIVRDFQGLIADVLPDESWIITCNGFTRSAKKYAKGFGIRLATLRTFAEKDWEDRVHKIVINVDILRPHEESPDLKIAMAEEDAAVVLSALAGTYDKINDVVKIFDGNRKIGFGEYLSGVASRVPIEHTGPVFTEGRVFDGFVELPNGSHYAVNGIEVSFKVSRSRQTITTTADQAAARLLLVDHDGLDFVLWEDALKGYRIDENTGEVFLGDDALQKKLVTTVIGSVPVDM